MILDISILLLIEDKSPIFKKLSFVELRLLNRHDFNQGTFAIFNHTLIVPISLILTI